MTPLTLPPVADLFGPSSRSAENRFQTYKEDLHRQLITNMDMAALDKLSDEELRQQVRQTVEQLCQLRPELLGPRDRERLVNEVLDETFGLGPLETLMRDPTITDILINEPKTVFVEREGRLVASTVTFRDDLHLLRIVQRVVARVGRRIDESSPFVDARLADGSRINAVVAPLALDGTLVSIRRFGTHPLLLSDLLARAAMTPEMARFLSACIRGRLNVVISGGTGSGKTTLLNALSASIGHAERIATIEDAAELRLQQPHVVRMETRPAGIEGAGRVTTRDLVRNALRMRPDRIVIGECRGEEALDMLQAMNTGHDGSMTTVHANDTRDAISRLEMMVSMASAQLQMWSIRRQITSAVQIVVQAARLQGGVRKVIKISEITGMEGDVITMHDLFVFRQTGIDSTGVARGTFCATGSRPACLGRLESAGVSLPPELFDEAGQQPTRGKSWLGF